MIKGDLKPNNQTSLESSMIMTITTTTILTKIIRLVRITNIRMPNLISTKSLKLNLHVLSYVPQLHLFSDFSPISITKYTRFFPEGYFLDN